MLPVYGIHKIKMIWTIKPSIPNHLKQIKQSPQKVCGMLWIIRSICNIKKNKKKTIL